MTSLLPIVSVQYVVLGNSIIDYLVIFTPSEYTYLRYDPNSSSGSSYEITAYTVFGVDIPVTGLAVPVAPVGRDIVFNFLQTTKPSLFSASSILIKYSAELDTNSNGYEMDMLTQSGVFFTRVHQKGFLYLSTITQVSFDTCADLDSSESVNNPVIASLNTFILQNYWQVSGYSLSLVQGFISSTGLVSYRMLYAKDSNRYEVQIVYQSGSYLINQLSYISGVGCQLTEAMLNGVC